MKLKSLVCHNIGPFDKTPMTFEPDITVITGRNDTGKSCVLRAIQLMLTRNANELAVEHDVNLDHISGVSKSWLEDERIACDGVFSAGLPGLRDRDAKLHAKLIGSQVAKTTYRAESLQGSGIQGVTNFPRCLLFRQEEDEGVRQVVTLSAMNPTEQRFIGVAFGPKFNATALRDLSDHKFEQIVGRAEAALNMRLNQMLPHTLRYRFRIKAIAGDRERLLVSLIDDHNFATDLSMRGTGIRKMINLLARLAIENIGTEPTIILIDEPETSLHADAQHTLRRFLEILATREHLQVIYTTHSPCMVNSMRPETLRLMERVENDDSACSRMMCRPYANGFSAIRSSLGMSPADSLLYAPVTIIVEGPTEHLCLPMLFARLARDQVPGFQDAPALLGSAIIVDANGSSNIPNMTRIAEGQGSEVVVFVDGDVKKSWRDRFELEHPRVPLIALPDGEEFEEIVPRHLYLATVQQSVGFEKDQSDVEFEDWLEKQTKRRAFTKHVEEWISDIGADRKLEKALVMRSALESMPTSDILNIDRFRDLLSRIRVALKI